jgi:hypothetical protein
VKNGLPIMRKTRSGYLARVEERLGISFEHVERGAVMIVRHFGTQGSKPLVQGLELRRVGRRSIPLEQRYDLPRFLRSVEARVFTERAGASPEGLAATVNTL